MNFGGILAGGIGSRMNAGGLPKQLMEVGGVPVIIRTIRSFLRCEKLDHVFVAMNAQWRDYADRLLNAHKIDRTRLSMIDGGATRFDSLVNLSNACLKACGNGDCVLLNHDCARPFVSQRILTDCLTIVHEYDMVTTSVPTIDTVLVSRNGKSSDCVPDRSTIFLDQGPQAFRVGQFLDLVDSLNGDERQKYMEAGRLYLDKGLSVGIVAGERTNFKLTTPFDIILAEAMLKEGEIK